MLLIVRRVVATVLAGAVFAGSLYAATQGTDCFTWVGLPLGGVALAALLLGMPPHEILVLRVADGGAVEIVERGVLSWGTRASTMRLPLRYYAGLVPDRDVPELGLGLGAESSAIYFTVAGVDRRDEARKLGHVLAARLHTGIEVVQDDVFCFVADLSEGLPAPQVEVTGGAYRTAALAPVSVDTARRPSFEAPAREPPRFVVGSRSELRDTVTVCDPEAGRFAATMAKSEPRIFTEPNRARARKWASGIAASAAGCGLLGLLIGWGVDHPLPGLGLGVAIGVAAPLGILIGTAVGAAVAGSVGSFLWLGYIALRGREPLKPGALVGARPRGWTLDVGGGVIELRGRIITRRVPTRKARAVAIVADDVGREHALWVKLGWRWVRLLRTGFVPGLDKPMIERLPGLASIATEIARALDVPLRYVR